MREYLVDLNAAQAAIRAGYSARSAITTGSRLLTVGYISRAIEEAKSNRAERTELTADWVISRLKQVAERCMQPKPVKQFDFAERKMIHRVDEGTGELLFTMDAAGANRALELLGKHQGLFSERMKVEGEVKVLIVKVDL